MSRLNWARAARKKELKRRIEAPADYLPPKCAIPACGRPTMRVAKQGLAVFHCKYHVQYKARHGSHWKKSYRASELKPYRQAAAIWIRRNREDIWVAHSLKALENTLWSAGPVEPATRIRGLPPHKRARIALARLREKGVPPEKLLAIYIAVMTILKEDPYSLRATEFRHVQIAKAVHRLASGTHRHWDFALNDGTTAPIEIHKYPRSSGRVLRHLGKMIYECCEFVDDRYLPAILDLKIERYGQHPAVIDPLKATLENLQRPSSPRENATKATPPKPLA